MGADAPSPGSARRGVQISSVLAYLCYNGCFFSFFLSVKLGRATALTETIRWTPINIRMETTTLCDMRILKES